MKEKHALLVEALVKNNHQSQKDDLTALINKQNRQIEKARNRLAFLRSLEEYLRNLVQYQQDRLNIKRDYSSLLKEVNFAREQLADVKQDENYKLQKIIEYKRVNNTLDALNKNEQELVDLAQELGDLFGVDPEKDSPEKVLSDFQVFSSRIYSHQEDLSQELEALTCQEEQLTSQIEGVRQIYEHYSQRMQSLEEKVKQQEEQVKFAGTAFSQWQDSVITAGLGDLFFHSEGYSLKGGVQNHLETSLNILHAKLEALKWFDKVLLNSEG